MAAHLLRPWDTQGREQRRRRTLRRCREGGVGRRTPRRGPTRRPLDRGRAHGGPSMAFVKPPPAGQRNVRAARRGPRQGLAGPVGLESKTRGAGDGGLPLARWPSRRGDGRVVIDTLSSPAQEASCTRPVTPELDGESVLQRRLTI